MKRFLILLVIFSSFAAFASEPLLTIQNKKDNAVITVQCIDSECEELHASFNGSENTFTRSNLVYATQKNTYFLDGGHTGYEFYPYQLTDRFTHGLLDILWLLPIRLVLISAVAVIDTVALPVSTANYLTHLHSAPGAKEKRSLSKKIIRNLKENKNTILVRQKKFNQLKEFLLNL